MMRRPQEIKVRPGARKSAATSIAAPIGGLNARDSVANMASSDATLMENWFPKTTSVDVRLGYTAWSTFTGICQTILVYTGVTSTSVYSCVKDGGTYSIFNSTSSGAVGAAVVGGGGATVEALTSTRFDYVMFGTSGGLFLTAVNGANNPLQYDGTTWTVSGVSGGTPADYFTVGVYGHRMWYGVNNSLRVRYGAIDAIAGATTAYELGPLFKLGGYLNSIITLTDQNNAGLADYIAFLSSEGEIVAFTGSDPSAAATWSLSAHFRIGRPVIKGNRSWVKWGTDAAVLCADGVYPLRKAIQANSGSGGLTITDKIRNLLSGDLALYGAKYGWQVIVHPTGAKMIVNVPTNEDLASYQYVMNTETGSWTKYTGWTAFCFEVARDTLYAGWNGKMVKADTGFDDAGTLITADVRQAYNYFGQRGITKHMKLLRPIMASDGAYSLGVYVNVDYKDVTPTYLRPVGSGGGDPWGGIWDAVWSGSVVADLKWVGVNGVGKAIAPRIKIQTNGTIVSWSATDTVYELGGILA